jgi:histidyl-tRNA synthetase
VAVYPEAGRKIEKALKYADGQGAPLLAILGEDEHAAGTVTIRDLHTREQQQVPQTDAGEWIARRLVV